MAEHKLLDFYNLNLIFTHRFGKRSEVDVSDGDNYDGIFPESDTSGFLSNYGGEIVLPVYGKRGDHTAERKPEYMRFG